MSVVSTTNASLTVCTAGTAHLALATTPDVCVVPGPVGPAPFPNWVDSASLVGGSACTLIADESVWTAQAMLVPSEPAHPGVGGGVASGAYRGAVVAVSFSPDVWIEGSPVVRESDATLHNAGNTDGTVQTKPLSMPSPSAGAGASACTKCMSEALYKWLVTTKSAHADPGKASEREEYLSRCGPAQVQMLYGIFQNQTARDNVDDIFGGAHVYLPDGGALAGAIPYDAKGADPGLAYPRTSSHPPYIENSDARAIDVGHSTILFGATNVDGDGTASSSTVGTRVQLEKFRQDAHPFEDVVHIVGWLPHVAAFVEYKVSGKNQGPIGSSKYKDKCPLKIPKGDPKEDPCAGVCG